MRRGVGYGRLEKNAMKTKTSIIVKPALALRFGSWGLDGKLHFLNHVLAVTDLQDASSKWSKIRDLRGCGASESPIVMVVDTNTGEHVAKVSYNGRVWATDGKEIVYEHHARLHRTRGAA